MLCQSFVPKGFLAEGSCISRFVQVDFEGPVSEFMQVDFVVERLIFWFVQVDFDVWKTHFLICASGLMMLRDSFPDLCKWTLKFRDMFPDWCQWVLCLGCVAWVVHEFENLKFVTLTVTKTHCILVVPFPLHCQIPYTNSSVSSFLKR